MTLGRAAEALPTSSQTCWLAKACSLFLLLLLQFCCVFCLGFDCLMLHTGNVICTFMTHRLAGSRVMFVSHAASDLQILTPCCADMVAYSTTAPIKHGSHQHQPSMVYSTTSMSGTSKAPPFKKYKILSHAIHSNRTAADAAADNFSPTSHGLAPEFHKFVHEGYSSIRDGMPVPEPHAKKLLVIGWCGDIQDLVDSLNMFAPGKTVVTVLCDCCPEVSVRVWSGFKP